jgi:hypothetical protein
MLFPKKEHSPDLKPPSHPEVGASLFLASLGGTAQTAQGVVQRR